MYQYAGLVYITILFFIWLIIFFKRKDLRKEMLLISFFTGILGPISEFFYKDYWKPEYAFRYLPMLEDYLFGFFIGGISAVIYTAIFSKRLIKKQKGILYWPMLFLIFTGLSILIILNLILEINSIYASFIAFIIVISIIWWRRPDLIKNSIYSGLFLAIMSIILYLFYLKLYPNIIQDWWLLHNISGILIFGIPIEEPIWFFLWGMIGGPLYEFWQKYGLKVKISH